MSSHLTSRQISETVAGSECPDTAAHLNECQACRAEVESFLNTLGQFRQSVRIWSEEPIFQPAVPQTQPALRRFGWPLALAACLVGLLAVPYARVPHPAAPRQAAISDAELLVQVDRQLSEAVPTSLEAVALRGDR